MSTPHTKLRAEITDWLKSIGAWYVCTNSQGYGRKGIPDILCCIRGKFVAIEVKVLPDKPSPWQMRELKGIQAAQGVSFFAYSLKETKALLGIVERGDHILSPDELSYEILNTPTQLNYVPK